MDTILPVHFWFIRERANHQRFEMLRSHHTYAQSRTRVRKCHAARKRRAPLFVPFVFARQRG